MMSFLNSRFQVFDGRVGIAVTRMPEKIANVLRRRTLNPTSTLAMDEARLSKSSRKHKKKNGERGGSGSSSMKRFTDPKHARIRSKAGSHGRLAKRLNELRAKAHRKLQLQSLADAFAAQKDGEEILALVNEFPELASRRMTSSTVREATWKKLLSACPSLCDASVTRGMPLRVAIDLGYDNTCPELLLAFAEAQVSFTFSFVCDS